MGLLLLNNEVLERLAVHFLSHTVLEGALAGTSANGVDRSIVGDISDELRLVQEGKAVALGLGVLESGANAGNRESVVFLDVEDLRLATSHQSVEHAL